MGVLLRENNVVVGHQRKIYDKSPAKIKVKVKKYI